MGLFRRKVADGYRNSSAVLSFNHDGLEVARVKNRSRHLPLWHFIFFIYLALLIRLVVAADIGTSGYEARLAEMRDGNVLERAAARVMRMDPVSQEIATKLRSGLSFLEGRVLDRDG
ncbi:hypothetical protein P1J78_23020 [Psychromarinibacter sp. C21-152]|uniref:Uncharacterized protein n=1 Tax=Psychromarinibacter sediminicola TaxID=3033385 RepID=A0AAE3TAE0_9RHOB|nr:hypothetical protein [Psychromarinibacter sediminicola]MDF0603605.1 hypothetical protein [Psychromarinibacter sediminicola]